MWEEARGQGVGDFRKITGYLMDEDGSGVIGEKEFIAMMARQAAVDRDLA